MSTRSVVTGIVAVIALAAGIGVGAVVFGGNSDGDDGAAGPTTAGPDNFVTTTTTTTAAPATGGGGVPPPPTVDEDGLESEALALARAINRAAELSYHAVFEGLTAAGSGGTGVGTLRVEVWRAPPRARRDTVLGLADQTIESVEIRLEDEVVGCARVGAEEPFDCRPNPDPEADPSAPLFDSVDPRAGTVTARDDVIAGTPVRCWIVITPTGAPQEACFDEAGIPALIDGGDGRLERTAVDTTVPDDIFTPPTG